DCHRVHGEIPSLQVFFKGGRVDGRTPRVAAVTLLARGNKLEQLDAICPPLFQSHRSGPEARIHVHRLRPDSPANSIRHADSTFGAYGDEVYFRDRAP